MATGGILGDGTKVAFSASSPVSWTEVTQVVNVDFPGVTPDKVNNDTHGSSGYHRSLPGLFTVNPMVITVSEDLDQATTADHDTLYDYLFSKTTLWWRIEVPTNRTKTTFTAFEFQGYVGSYLPSTPIDDRQTSEISVEFDGTSFTRYASGASAL